MSAPFQSMIFAPQAAYSAAFLCHFDGTNGSTTFTDSSANSIALTAVGNAQISTAQSVAGGASGLFDGSGDRVEAAATAALKIVADFTIEGWVRFNSLATASQFFTLYNSGINSIHIGCSSPSSSKLQCSGLTGPTTLSTGTWYHVAFTRSGTWNRLFLDGTLEADNAGGGGTVSPVHSADPTLHIGGAPTLFHLNGHMDDWRVIVGTCLYTASFTPPTPPLS